MEQTLERYKLCLIKLFQNEIKYTFFAFPNVNIFYLVWHKVTTEEHFVQY